MSDKRIDLESFISLLRAGMTIGIGGWAARRRPMALVREICRSPVRDLTVVSCGAPTSVSFAQPGSFDIWSSTS